MEAAGFEHRVEAGDAGGGHALGDGVVEVGRRDRQDADALGIDQERTGKTMITSSMIAAACARGERCMSFVFEESGDQIIRNARSIGLDLARHVEAGLLRFEAARPSLYGLDHAQHRRLKLGRRAAQRRERIDHHHGGREAVDVSTTTAISASPR
jgi:circadian clock protein KaiC